eukprot:TRINITY_DN27977_c0_g1_i1.p1 TRINITY_DN27977_c0_g1~~TRINITY_DN27977_c0_g1_i1.p1  ORF type:complete len:613 (-),score=82.80 TRINITY_DN27977_c0_g1_i1:175-2013(-)
MKDLSYDTLGNIFRFLCPHERHYLRQTCRYIYGQRPVGWVIINLCNGGFVHFSGRVKEKPKKFFGCLRKRKTKLISPWWGLQASRICFMFATNTEMAGVNVQGLKLVEDLITVVVSFGELCRTILEIRLDFGKWRDRGTDLGPWHGWFNPERLAPLCCVIAQTFPYLSSLSCSLPLPAISIVDIAQTLPNLNFVGEFEATNAALHALLTNCPKLTRLHLTLPPTSQLLTPSIVTELLCRCTAIQHLEIDGITLPLPIANALAAKPFRTPDRRFRQLVLQPAAECSQKDITVMAELAGSGLAEELVFNASLCSVAPEQVTMLSRARGLRSVRLLNLTEVREFEVLAHAPNLYELIVLASFTPATHAKQLGIQFGSLRRLTLGRASESPAAFIAMCPGLTYLSTNSMWTTDIAEIAPLLTGLTELDLGNLLWAEEPAAEERALQAAGALARHCRRLVKLSIEATHYRRFDAFLRLLGEQIEPCPGLQLSLDLSTTVLQPPLLLPPHLQFVRLAAMLDSHALLALAANRSTAGSLVHLHIRGSDITDSGLASLCRAFTSLTSLELVNCRALTDAALTKGVSAIGPRLRSLVVRGNVRLASIERVQQACPWANVLY